jgi:peroxiredoxin
MTFLRRGDSVPPLAGNDVTGKPVVLSELGEQVWLILSRFAACPFCSLRLDKISKRYTELSSLGVNVLVVFPSAVEQMKRYVKAYDPPFRVMADPDEEIFERFFVQTSWAGEARSAFNLPRVAEALRATKMSPLPIDAKVHQMPADFLIRGGVRIDNARYGRQLDDGFSVDEVLEWARGRKSDVPSSMR